MRASRFFAAVAGWLAAGVPAVFALRSAAPFGQLGDAPAFTAQVFEHPATPAELLARLCALIPLGPLSLRVSLASGLAFALLASASYRAIESLLRAQGVLHDGLRAETSLGLCWLATSATPLFDAGVRPGVAVLTAALIVLALGELQRLRLEPAAPSCGRLALALGLLLAQDAAAFLLISPAVVAGSSGLPIRADRRLVVQAAAALGGGVALQLRAWAAPAATDFELGLGLGSEVVRAVIEHQPFTSVTGLLGAIAIAQTRRVPALRRCGLAWSLAWIALVALGSGSPGALCAVAPIGLVLTAALAGALAVPDGTRTAFATPRKLAIAAVVAAAGAWQLQLAAARGDASDFTLPEAWAASTLDRMPARALVLAHDRERGTLARAAAVETRSRPDLRIVSVAELGEPRYARALAESVSLRPLVRSYLFQAALSRPELESLSAERPVLLDEPVTQELHAALRPERLWYEVAGSRVARSENRAAESAFGRARQDLARDAGDAERPAARAFLERIDVVASQYFASRADSQNRP